MCNAFQQHDFLGIRGRILPRAPEADNSFAGLYDLGEYPVPAVLDLEGNMAVPAKTYKSIGGMNPLLFGNEGLEMSFRLIQAYPGKKIYYWPSMQIRHDYAKGQNLLAKRKRQALAYDYFERTNPGVNRLRQEHHQSLKSLNRQKPGLLGP